MHITKTGLALLAAAALCSCQAQPRREGAAPTATASAAAAASPVVTQPAASAAPVSPAVTQPATSAAPASPAPPAGTMPAAPSATAPPAGAAAPGQEQPAATADAAERQISGAPVAGSYAGAGSNELYVRRAEVSDLGSGQYHIEVTVTCGDAGSAGSIAADFKLQDGIFRAVDTKLYPDVTASFRAGSLTIDYPGTDNYGGMNASPRGVYYLQKPAAGASPYWTKLIEAAHMSAVYRQDLLEADVIDVNGKGQELVLLRSKSSADRQQFTWEGIVLHGPGPGAFLPLGDVNDFTRKALVRKLADYGFDSETGYRALRQSEYVRYLHVRYQRADKGMAMPDGDQGVPLSEQEAFYIATGVDNATDMAYNLRDQNDIGSILITAVDSSSSAAVNIHRYEDVRNDSQDRHTATLDWIRVDRRTGKVSGMLDEQ